MLVSLARLVNTSSCRGRRMGFLCFHGPTFQTRSTDRKTLLGAVLQHPQTHEGTGRSRHLSRMQDRSAPSRGSLTQRTYGVIASPLHCH